ncbi:MAG TPA: hypothetical protein PKB10_03085 [Tepidisphaeraceae bacterium]|nr:hypothetical protein [Tepidisphaeraceae bacterium]
MLKATVFREVRRVGRTSKRRSPRPSGILASFESMLGKLTGASSQLNSARRRAKR